MVRGEGDGEEGERKSEENRLVRRKVRQNRGEAKREGKKGKTVKL